MSGFWESCLQRFEQELPAQQFNTWIKPLRLEGESTVLEDGLRLIAPEWFHS
jgi:chromosomal replication initiator protein